MSKSVPLALRFKQPLSLPSSTFEHPIWLLSLCCWNSILLKSNSLPTLSPEPEQVNLDEGKSKIRSAGLPYFTLMTISENCSVVSDSLQPHGLYSPWNSPGQNTGVGNLSLLQGIFPTQGSNPGLPHCRQILYQLNLQVKLKNTRVGSLSLLQEIFPTQELNQGLLHCRQILYQLNY